MARRIAELGNQLPEDVSSLDTSTDWFMINDAMKLFCNNGRVAIEIHPPFDLGEADDWVISFPDSYVKATIISESMGIETKLARLYEKAHPSPTYASPFHFTTQCDQMPTELLNRTPHAAPRNMLVDETALSSDRVVLALPG